ncbi:MAG: phosphoenolpyruvate mutase, partial [Gammaproteobacteria bacterium]|nr:phosphoenolpyruvate mutase [Gammaproteobacteria bacterium]
MAAELKPRVNQSKTTRLKAMLKSSELEFILEAHNGISARIVEEAGFNGIWASGLALSAQFGVRDNNEASWTQIVDMLEFMSDATRVPILLDGDTGYGNFNNLRRLVRKLEQRGVAGVCIEDKLFPKTNSFIAGERQPLADIDEFSGKIAAGKDSQSDDDFCIVARVEALIAGWDVSEAIRRAEAYHAAGADAILIHSKLSRADEILAFADAWQNRAPVVIVPTKYYSTPVEVYREAGISMVIWANHMIRSAVQAMQDTAERIARDQSLSNIEDGIARVNELFRLQGADELASAEQRYLANRASATRAVILAATRGSALQSLTHDRPKAMIPVNGKPLLRRMIDKFKRQGVNDVTVVGGYKAEAIQLAGIEVLVNEQHESTGELASLRCALDRL